VPRPLQMRVLREGLSLLFDAQTGDSNKGPIHFTNYVSGLHSDLPTLPSKVNRVIFPLLRLRLVRACAQNSSAEYCTVTSLIRQTNMIIKPALIPDFHANPDSLLHPSPQRIHPSPATFH
jgi:hypothetical protein